ncbi:polysaccharide biosynthesis C-terminal domain-containing protein [Methanonatronarchaeum sp. AMET-Sl]|uniref:lipopolysaccharide biosynthesis protein n=1 Tax=Methanonatronarchaeum sp. AMET-Sl TaxID=3037654 RepID=UPI00244DCB48|nr:polysaccharide biosynthesis C-terminal domain-containing protein [Methanonatronarchaeum sp. AMET-Sl]WGI17658.1 oligosaccharide flippase family protein [Methanonatronarchaeum sp. AMET-Sl]
MSISKSSIGVFLAKIGVAVIGFLGVTYAARVAGAEALGIYYLFTAVVSFLTLFTTFGIGSAVTKRVSEDREQGEFLAAGFSINLVLYIFLCVILVAFRNQFISYIGSEILYYLIFPATLFIVLKKPIKHGLKGERRVATGYSLGLVQSAVRVFVWVVLLGLGLGAVGLGLGYLFGYLAGLVVGAILLSIKLKKPSRRHYKGIYDFAKYSWLGSVKTRVYSKTDVLVLGLFVSPMYIGIYEIAWMIASVFFYVSRAISSVLFPNISYLASNGEISRIESLITESLIYIPIFAFPGIFGAILIGEGVLKIFGEEFVIGYIILTILIVGKLLGSFNAVMTKVINGLDRPDLSFNVYAVFIFLNVSANFILIYMIGWVGAAIATVLSLGIALTMSYRYLSNLINIKIPTKEITKEFTSAIIMAITIYIPLQYTEPLTITQTIAYIILGTIIYLSTLLTISPKIRRKLLKITKKVLQI